MTAALARVLPWEWFEVSVGTMFPVFSVGAGIELKEPLRNVASPVFP
jgi:hypothetical protein